MGKLLVLALFSALGLSAQTAQTVPMNDLETDFQESLTGVVLEGQYTHDGSPGVSADKYTIEKIVKTGEDRWTFFASIEFKGQAMTVPLPLQVKWAGDTPVITVTDMAVPGMGTYTARVVVYRGQYAGTWSAGKGGGKLFGRIVKK
ncbi:MAG TPA: hypothetical protein VMH81_34460 [Bryobacteraceae bacterium]|nr:hypothetical protein [Bryobacteraceae bacterium]